ncbi:hypothetical protein OROGR_020941 [Orobanche gracilis]
MEKYIGPTIVIGVARIQFAHLLCQQEMKADRLIKNGKFCFRIGIYHYEENPFALDDHITEWGNQQERIVFGFFYEFLKIVHSLSENKQSCPRRLSSHKTLSCSSKNASQGRNLKEYFASIKGVGFKIQDIGIGLLETGTSKSSDASVAKSGAPCVRSFKLEDAETEEVSSNLPSVVSVRIEEELAYLDTKKSKPLFLPKQTALYPWKFALSILV